VDYTFFHDSCLEPLSYEFLAWNLTEGTQQKVVVDVVKSPLDVCINYPPLALIRAC